MQYKNLTITKYIQDGFRIDENVGNVHRVFYIDPFKLPDNQPKADVVLITHDHFDHCDPESIARILKPETLVVGSTKVAAKLGELNLPSFREVNPHSELDLAGTKIMTLSAYNLNKFREPGVAFHPETDKGMGYMITFSPQTPDVAVVYHMGDTDFLPDEQTGHAIDVLMIPVSGTYVMTVDEAIEACKQIKPKFVIPMHYDGGVVGSWEDAERLKQNAGCNVEVMEAIR